MRNVSLAYGKSNSASNGRYFAVWERLPSSTSRNGNIYTSRNISTVDGPWITPMNLDSLSSTMIGLCRNPSIAVQYNNIDNDSGAVTAVVLVERDYNGDGSDYDLLGFYNMRAHYTNNWFRLDVVNNGENDMQPDITYDPGNNNFLAVYFDSTNGKLPYCINGMNLTTPSTWGYITPQYNDNTALTAAWPRVEINPMVTQTAHVWISKSSGMDGIAMFDGEYVFTGIAEQQDPALFADDQIYPNPASSLVNLSFSTSGDNDVVIKVFDTRGRIVEQRQAGNRKAGNWLENFDVSSWDNGVYTFSVSSGTQSFTKMLVVSH
jgi:hypothetical protein